MNGGSPAEQPGMILSTPRLILRAASYADIPVMHDRIFGDADVMRRVFLGQVMTANRSSDFMREHFTFGASRTGLAILAEKHDGTVIGFAGLLPCKALGANDFEIGFVLAKTAWGKGYATEIGCAQLAMGFEEIGCARLLAQVDPENTPSIRALEKLGMRYVKNVTSPTRALRRVYVVFAEDWRASKA